MKSTLILISLILLSSTAFANKAEPDPYYAAIRADEANVRTGPSVRYPIKWTYQRQGWPVEILASFEQWHKVKDIDGDQGWVHESLITKNRRVIVQGEGIVKIHRLPIANSAPIMLAEKGVIAPLLSCKNHWCKVKLAGDKGWIQRKHLWGVYAQEEIE